MANERSNSTPIQPLRLRIHPDGTFCDITEPLMTLGRHSTADIILPLPEVSRKHCRFSYSSEGWRIEDLNSLNGIMVNGQRVNQANLHQGDRIRISHVELEVELSQTTADFIPAIAARLNLSEHRKAS